MEKRAQNKSSVARRATIIFCSFSLFLIVVAISYAQLFGPVGSESTKRQFLVKPGEPVSQIANDLAAQGYVRSAWILQVAYLHESYGKGIRAGGYEISKDMDAWSLASALVEPPYYAWVTIPVGVRKEQIAAQLRDELGWTPQQVQEFNTVDTNPGPNFVEGVYFPDDYLIPSDLPPAQVAVMLRDRFKVAFAPYADEALARKIPSIISGVIQKRLKVGMPLAMDATLQYMEGNEENGWWPEPASASTYPDDPFNTYKRKGLPPHPIANPGLAAIDAALHPEETNCLFYLHDTKGKIHCSATYKGQQANVSKYLK